jgi:hypothetical protein
MLRGMDAVTGEWTLVCIAFNLKRFRDDNNLRRRLG